MIPNVIFAKSNSPITMDQKSIRMCRVHKTILWTHKHMKLSTRKLSNLPRLWKAWWHKLLIRKEYFISLWSWINSVFAWLRLATLHFHNKYISLYLTFTTHILHTSLYGVYTSFVGVYARAKICPKSLYKVLKDLTGTLRDAKIFIEALKEKWGQEFCNATPELAAKRALGSERTKSCSNSAGHIEGSRRGTWDISAFLLATALKGLLKIIEIFSMSCSCDVGYSAQLSVSTTNRCARQKRVN